MIVYLVTEGCYSDYHIEGVFSTRELAEQFIKNNTPANGKELYGREYNVEEWTLDEKKDEKTEFGTQYIVQLSLSSGNIGNEISRESHEDVAVYPNHHYPVAYLYEYESIRFPSYVQGMSLVSFDEAKKVAAEKVQEWQRKKIENFQNRGENI